MTVTRKDRDDWKGLVLLAEGSDEAEWLHLLEDANNEQGRTHGENPAWVIRHQLAYGHQLLRERDARIAELEAEVADLRAIVRAVRRLA
jgi:hypothetical protein